MPMRFWFTIAFALIATDAIAADEMDWAYPVTPKAGPLDSVRLKQAPGSERQYTQAQIDDPFNPPDWFPNEHPPMPDIVARGGAGIPVLSPSSWAGATGA